MSDGLCENPECGAFLDRDVNPIRWDREEGVYVVLCPACAESCDGDPKSRYQRYPDNPPNHSPKGE